MRIRLGIATSALVLLVVACGTTYTRPDTTAEQLNSDLEQCKAIARGENPGDWTPDGPDYQARNSVGCEAGDCQAKPGQNVHGSPSIDMDRAGRERATIACMEARGYEI